MKALVWHQGGEFAIEEVPRPSAESGRLVVKVAAAAVCGSDFHLADFGALPPLIPGHEVSGTVAKIGAGVKGFKIGERVTLNPVQFCRTCWCCTHGLPHLCENYRHLGDKGVSGAWAEYVAIDAANAHKIPENVSFYQACLIEPCAVCYESFRRAGLEKNNNVLIIGDGPFGFLHAQIAKAWGAGKIIVAGHYDKRLERIKNATGAIVCNTHGENLESLLSTVIGPPGVDIVIEATGAGNSPNIGIRALRPCGTIVIFSYIWKPEPLEMGQIHIKEINVLGACRSLNAFEPCLKLLQKCAIDTGLLIDVKIPLEDYASAVRALRNRKAEIFKAIFVL